MQCTFGKDAWFHLNLHVNVKAKQTQILPINVQTDKELNTNIDGQLMQNVRVNLGI